MALLKTGGADYLAIRLCFCSMIFLKNGTEVVEITKELRRLYNKEPAKSRQREILRSAIMGYELADIQKFTVKNAQANLPVNIKSGLEANAKLGMADLITQCRMLCFDFYWNFDEIQNMGLKHLKERHVELKRDGFADK